MSTFSSAKGRSQEEVADKVRKLLALAEDPAATPEEAQAFTMKAQELMTKYAISLAMISDADRVDDFVVRDWDLLNPYAGHKVTLVNAVARANDCRAVYTDLGGGRKMIQVIGYPTDVDWVQTLSSSLQVQMAAALSTAIRSKPDGVHGRTFAVGFVQGFVAEVASRLRAARKQAVAASESAHGGGSSVALVLLAKIDRVEEEFNVRFPGTRTVYRQVRLRSWAGFRPGQAAGRAATMARGAVGDGRRGLTA